VWFWQLDGGGREWWSREGSRSYIRREYCAVSSDLLFRVVRFGGLRVRMVKRQPFPEVDIDSTACCCGRLVPLFNCFGLLLVKRSLIWRTLVG
jgi:hypothetical protein